MILRITDPEGRRFEHQLGAEPLRIGRSTSAGLTIPDPELSRHHAEIAPEGDGAYTVRDLGSLNGTLLNGQRLEEAARLAPDDVLELGQSRIVFAPTGLSTATGSERVVPLDTGTIVALSTTGGGDESGRLSTVVYEAARELVSDSAAEEKLERLLGLALRTTLAERGMVAVRDQKSGSLRALAFAPASLSDAPPLVSRTLQERVLGLGESVIVEEIADDASMREARTFVDAGVRSVLCAPLGHQGNCLGIFYLDTQGRRASFTPEHLETAAIVAGIAGIVVESETTRAELEAKRRMDAELKAAYEIQNALLAERRPVCPTPFTVAGHHEPSRGVSGDVFDVFELPDGRMGVMVADVAGKGLAAALLGSSLHARWKGLLARRPQPEIWLRTLNEELARDLPDNRFVTLAFAVCDPKRGKLIYGSAGQESLAVRGGQVERLVGTGAVLGLFSGAPFDLDEIDFSPGDRIMLFSDGLLDQRTPEGVPLDHARLGEVLASSTAAGADAAGLMDAVVSFLAAHARDADQDDDTTLAVLGLSE